MSNFKWYKFDELYKMSSGISSTPAQAGHGSPFVSFSTVFNNYFLPDELDSLMETSEREQEIYSVKEGDIFLTRTSETIDELGMSSVAVKNYPTATFSGFLKRLRPLKNNVIYHKYIGFYLRSRLFRKTITNNAIMTLRASLNEDIFSYLFLYLPEYEVQKRIGNLLFLLNAKIELNRQINAELEAMTKTLYDYWFVQFDFPDYQGKPYKSSGGLMGWDEKLNREIPLGWSLGTLSTIARIVGGSTPSTEIVENFSADGTAWITPKDLSLNQGNKFITKGELDVSDLGLKAASLTLMPPGTVLFSSRAPVGYMAISRREVTTNQGFKSFVPRDGYSTEFIYYTVKNLIPAIKNYASGSTFKEISSSTLQTVPILVPKKTVIEKYVKSVEGIFRRQEILEAENQQLEKLRDWLLPMLINGQVKVTETNVNSVT